MDRLPPDDLLEEVSDCAAASVKETKQELVAALHQDTGAISSLRILHLYLERLGCDFQVPLFFLLLHVSAASLSRFPSPLPYN